MKNKFLKYFLYGSCVLIVIGFFLPQKFVMPVRGAGKNSYNQKSFWYYPWGKSVTHKGVDVFAKEGTDLISSTDGLVVFAGEIKMGGKVVLVLGPKWRLHYYAHLKDITAKSFTFVSPSEKIGTVGSTGNAAGKPAHLHYSIVTIFPYVWKMDSDRQGWKKMFYLNPIPYLNELKYSLN